jgi:hypothetical protein
MGDDTHVQITHLGTGKRVDFTLDSIVILEIYDGSKVVVRVVDH